MNSEVITVGMPFSWNGIFGHVCEIDSGVVRFITPHGSKMEMGWYHFVTNISYTNEDKIRLEELIEDARTKGVLAHNYNT